MFRSNSALVANYKSAFVAYCILFLGLTSPYLLFGEVAAPHRQYIEIGAIDTIGVSSKLGQIENRKFSDYTNAYIPEISTHLKGARSSWLTLWTNQNELGRPVYQTAGFSPAYLPSWVIAKLTDSPWQFITTLSLFTCFFAGAFIILFCREVGLHPLAGLIAGISLAASPLFMYWLTFPMFPAIWCWSAGALWAVSRLAKKPDDLGWAVLAFSGYSLLLTAHPQPVVFHAYLLGGYGFFLAHRRWRASPQEAVRFVVIALSALVVGAGLACPVYRDLAVLSAESARVAPDPSFFTIVLPKFASFVEVVRFFVLGTVPEFFGNPVSATFPLPYDGLSVTLPVVFFAVVGGFSAFKRTWGWWLAIGVFCLFAFVHPLYVFGVKFLGFNLSRSTPIGSIMLPLTVIVALGVDELIKRDEPSKISSAVIAGVGCMLMIIAVGVSYGLTHSLAMRWWMVVLSLLMAGMLAAQYQQTRPWLVVSALIIVLASVSYPLMLRQDPAQIATTSPLVERVRNNLPEGSHFAVAAPGVSVLPPNLNAGLGLSSIHSYNSLSSTRYHTLIKALGGEMQTYGRWNGAIAPDYSGTVFWMSNISLMLSPTKFEHDNLEYLGYEAGVHLHKVISRMGDSLQVVNGVDMTIDTLDIADVRLIERHTPRKLVDKGDVLEFEVVQGAPSVLILSQKFHRDWQAQALGRDGWQPALTGEVNGVFQGVQLPENSQSVRLEFKPFARYAWIAHVFWLLMLVLIGFKSWQKSRQGTIENA